MSQTSQRVDAQGAEEVSERTQEAYMLFRQRRDEIQSDFFQRVERLFSDHGLDTERNRIRYRLSGIFYIVYEEKRTDDRGTVVALASSEVPRRTWFWAPRIFSHEFRKDFAHEALHQMTVAATDQGSGGRWQGMRHQLEDGRESGDRFDEGFIEYLTLRLFEDTEKQDSGYFPELCFVEALLKNSPAQDELLSDLFRLYFHQVLASCDEDGYQEDLLIRAELRRRVTNALYKSLLRMPAKEVNQHDQMLLNLNWGLHEQKK